MTSLTTETPPALATLGCTTSTAWASIKRTNEASPVSFSPAAIGVDDDARMAAEAIVVVRRPDRFLDPQEAERVEGPNSVRGCTSRPRAVQVERHASGIAGGDDGLPNRLAVRLVELRTAETGVEPGVGRSRHIRRGLVPKQACHRGDPTPLRGPEQGRDREPLHLAGKIPQRDVNSTQCVLSDPAPGVLVGLSLEFLHGITRIVVPATGEPWGDGVADEGGDCSRRSDGERLTPSV